MQARILAVGFVLLLALHASQDMRRAFGCVCSAGPMTSEALADQLGWRSERAAETLAVLVAQRLASAEGDEFHPLPLP